MIGIYPLEPQYLNIALEKVRLFYRVQGIQVETYYPLFKDHYEKVYCSSIFTYSDKSYVTDDMICGDTGFNLNTTLPEEIEMMKPKINVGFISRGCCRNCPFCVVPEKEGAVHPVGDIYDFWDGEAKQITILDNNILALPGHFQMIANELKTAGIKADFNQGFDIRLINDWNAKILGEMKHTRYYHFGWDLMNYTTDVLAGIDILKKYIKPKRLLFLVLIGYNTIEEQDLYRVQTLNDLGVECFVQIYNNIKTDYTFNFARWVNRKAIFKTVTWKEYQKKAVRV